MSKNLCVFVRDGLSEMYTLMSVVKSIALIEHDDRGDDECDVHENAMEEWANGEDERHITIYKTNGSVMKIWEVLMMSGIPFGCDYNKNFGNTLTSLACVLPSEVIDEQIYPDFETWCLGHGKTADVILTTYPPKTQRNEEAYKIWEKIFKYPHSTKIREIIKKHFWKVIAN